MKPDEEADQPEETEFDDTEWNPSDDPTDYSEFWSAQEIVDRILDGEATDARNAIYSTLYQKVGERIEAMRPEMRSSMGLPTTEPPFSDETTDFEVDGSEDVILDDET